MSSSSPWTTLDDYVPSSLPVSLNRAIIGRAMESARAQQSWVLIFVVGTKPCFNKVYGAVQACARKGLPFFVIDANQHYDSVLTFGLEEFSFTDHVGVNLQLRGDLAQKSGEMFFKVSRFARWLRENWREVTAVPVVNGDTILCPIVPAAWMFARREKSIQNEAGLRSMAPDLFRQMPLDITVDDFVSGQWHGGWHLLRTEPFPEQWDTYVSAAGCEHHMAPVDLNRQHLLREGYPADGIHLVGGVVNDALAWKRKEKMDQSVFELYPPLRQGKWVRLDIHRKENLGQKRFAAIFGALEQVVASGQQVSFVLMNATKHAIERWGFAARLNALRQQPNFLATEVWPAYGHVVEFYDSDHCLAAWTDSGGVQEDMNILGKPCLTIRFNTDRPETVMGNHGNVLVPPISPEFLARVTTGILNDRACLDRLTGAQSVYGSGAGERFAAAIEPQVRSNARAFRWSQNILGFDRSQTDDDPDF